MAAGSSGWENSGPGTLWWGSTRRQARFSGKHAAKSSRAARVRSRGYDGDIVKEPALYHATPEDVIEVLNGASDEARSVLIVGHNPGFEDLVRKLTGESHGMPTAALFVLDVPIGRWSELDLEIDAAIVESWQPR